MENITSGERIRVTLKLPFNGFFSALTFKQSSENVFFSPSSSLFTKRPSNIYIRGMPNVMLKYYLLYSDDLKPQSKPGLQVTAIAEPPV